MLVAENWPYLVSGVCAFLLCCLILALIFSSDFREDITSGNTNKTKIFNIITLEGALVLSLCGLFFYGLIQPVINPPEPFSLLVKANGLSFETPSQFLDDYKQKVAELNEKKVRVTELESELKGMIKEESLLSYIKALSPDAEFSVFLRELPLKHEGPWGRFKKSETILVSIPGDVKEGEAWVCHSRINDHFELISDLKINEEPVLGKSVKVSSTKLMFPSIDCEERVSIDMQIACVNAVQLFGDSVLACDDKGNARWKIQKPRELSVLSVLLPEELVENRLVDN
ncbi:hypothetical protein [Endozoicomonas numazuensis]|uniref:Uncharacterized protein n=1 Tax=Endozoicomonas numazuensis TaxID=1137799 RepID=A0A081NG01_9GAMM|nr:hypothetical protein [Endozoicomonas numazuensis]KEQ17374.1 hypothetical protein GZ78_16385 [Endozoicomonas numazuensis]